MSQSRTYLITGSASGIGAATAKVIEGRGGRVIGCDLRNADIEIDLSTAEGRQALVDQAAKLGPLDAVLAVAGGGHTGMIETNYFGAVATLEGLRPLLLQSDAPRAAAVASTASLSLANNEVVELCLAGDEPGAVAAANAVQTDNPTALYGYAKRALTRWVRRVAPTADWGGSGIPLNIVAPGVIDTPAAQYILQNQDVRDTIESRSPQPLGFPGRPEWVGELLYWLTSPENPFVTGQIIFCDGGADASMLGDRLWAPEILGHPATART
jgi:NAD(P)-dependent dehydrogenase (short-subunit alcohol dehydrogenase family)